MSPVTPADPDDLDREARDAEERAARTMWEAIREHRRLVQYAERMRIAANMAREGKP